MIRCALGLLATTALAATSAAAAEVQIAAQGPVVELTVSESVEAEPDIATVSAGVTTQARTAVEAMRTNAQAMNAVVDRIEQLGVAERDIQASGISLGAMYDYDQSTQRQVFRGYQASNRVSVRLRDIQRTGEVLDALVAAGATDLGGPEWSIDDSDLRLLEINETVAPSRPMPIIAQMARAEAADASTPVRPGMVEATVIVTVKYELTR